MGSVFGWSRVAAAAGAAALVALCLTPALGVSAVSSNPRSVVASSSGSWLAATQTPSCEPDGDNDFDNNQESDNNANDDQGDVDDKGNNECPPPVVPEAPLAALLPLSAGVLIGGTYLLMRLRGRNHASA